MHSTKDNLQVLYEDNHIIAVNKRPGDIVQGDKTRQTLGRCSKEYIAHKYTNPELFLGCRSSFRSTYQRRGCFCAYIKALTRLNKLFAERTTEKIYWAVVKNEPPKEKDTLVHYMVRNSKQNKSYANNKEIPNGKKAILHYRLIRKLNHYYALEITLETGRHHQIRSQLSAIGIPIKGDLKYGFDRSNPDGSIHLHARELRLTHPVSKEVLQIIAPTPDDVLWNAVL